MPPRAIETLHAAMSAALKQPDMVERLRQTDQEVVAASPAETAARLAADHKTWGAVAKRIGLQLD
jgi:tripartite-type tricarboxylate transporter receptor subunit TctC